MATDHEVTEEIRKYLDGADLEQVTQKTVRKHLAARFPGLDVSARKDFIKEQVVALLSPPAEPAAGHSKAGASSAATSRNGSSSAAAAAADEDEPTDIGKSDRSCKQVVPRHLQGAQSKSKKRKMPKTLDGSEPEAPAKKARGGYQKPVELSQPMAEFMGAPSMSRSEVVQKMWAYIKENNLPKEKGGVYMLDDRLQTLLSRKTIDFKSMSKAIKPHIIEAKDGAPAGGSSSSKKKASHASAASSKSASGKKKSKAAPGGGAGGWNAFVKLSPELEAVLGQPAMPRMGVTKGLWKYIKANNLQKEGDRRFIVCDAALRRVFGTPEVHMFSMNKVLNKHMLGPASEDEIKAAKALAGDEDGADSADKDVKDEEDEEEDEDEEEEDEQEEEEEGKSEKKEDSDSDDDSDDDDDDDGDDDDE